MAIDTSIVITRPVRLDLVRELFGHCRYLIGGTDRRATHGDSTYWRPGNREFVMVRGQGLPAQLRVVYGLDRPLVDRDGDCDMPTAFAEVVYSSDGVGSADLHAWLIRYTGCWLDWRRQAWQWQHDGGPWRTGLAMVRRVGDPAAGERIATGWPQ